MGMDDLINSRQKTTFILLVLHNNNMAAPPAPATFPLFMQFLTNQQQVGCRFDNNRGNVAIGTYNPMTNRYHFGAAIYNSPRLLSIGLGVSLKLQTSHNYYLRQFQAQGWWTTVSTDKY